MVKPNISESVRDLLQTYWSLTGELDKRNIDFPVDDRDSVKTNNATVMVEKGREFSHAEGLPKGTVNWTEQEVYVSPLYPLHTTGCYNRLWEMKREVQRIFHTYPTLASGVERMWSAPRSPRNANTKDPYQGNEVVIICFWREPE